ncbi:Peptidase family C78 [Phytophthora infestans]|uniref:Peptidase family C78 n=1 Tax=Phytophthora infestans TaxID=4787 RepID=A0A833SI34_PHYIN|nr:Peptidase family C78 [Phytophthora infestans]
MQGHIPAPLLRSLRRFATPDEVEDGDNIDIYSSMAHGEILGTQRGVKSSADDALVTQQVAVWGLLRLSPEDADGHSFVRNLPGGVGQIGRFVVVREEAAEEENCLESVALQLGTDEYEGSFVLIYVLATQLPILYHCKDGEAVRLEMQVVQCLHARDFHRAIGFTPLRCAVDLHMLGDKRALLHQLEKYKAASCDADSFYVRVGVTQGKKSRSFRVLNGRGEDVTSADTKTVELESILPEVGENEDSGETKSKKKSAKKQKKGGKKTPVKPSGDEEDKLGFLPSLEYGDIANIDVLISLAPLDATADVAAPVISIPTPSASKKPPQRFHAHCDALVMVPVDSSMESALAFLRQQLHEQLTEVASRLKGAPEAVTSVTAHQFPLVGAAFPLMVICSDCESLDDVKTLESLHRAFFQPLDQPLFRVSRGCSLAQQGEWLASSDVLFNVHEGIPRSGVGDNCQSALVDGFYGYYHYLQQGMNDKGWGCAYRSLQTLASWLFVQHYTQQRFLSYEQIQSALVKIGDKPARFQGSTEWIGSLEVGYVLDELYGVTFRSLSVSSGAQLPDVARELLYHFETQGTPVMMGGGQLAFTLLGVDYDPDAGVCAFLTLDPHYTGDEDLATIQHQTVTLEGYKAVPCSWRKTTTFAKNSFYNLCLPQRPSVGV